MNQIDNKSFEVIWDDGEKKFNQVHLNNVHILFQLVLQ